MGDGEGRRKMMVEGGEEDGPASSSSCRHLSSLDRKIAAALVVLLAAGYLAYLATGFLHPIVILSVYLQQFSFRSNN